MSGQYRRLRMRDRSRGVASVLRMRCTLATPLEIILGTPLMATVQLVLVTVVLLSCVQTGTTQNDGKSVSCTATLYHQITVHCTVEAISAAVLEALLPILNETRSGVEAIRRDLEQHKLYVNRTVSETSK